MVRVDAPLHDRLAVLLTGRPDRQRVPLSEVHSRPPRTTSRTRLAEVLEALGLLDDDTVQAIRAWVDRRTAELPPGFAAPVRAWLLLLLDGDARARPRSHRTLYVYFNSVRPHIEAWSANRDHLRDMTAKRNALELLEGALETDETTQSERALSPVSDDVVSPVRR